MKLLPIILLSISILPHSIPAAYRITDTGVVFTYNDANANTVALSGSFNNWKSDDIMMEQYETGKFTVEIELAPGEYQYKFIVDDVWKNDTDNPNNIDDSYGGINSVLIVHGRESADKLQSTATEGKAAFKYYNPDAQQVFLAGDFNDWNPNLLSMQEYDGEWIIFIALEAGEYEYKFVVDDAWMPDPMNPTIRGDMGNSVINIDENGNASYPAGTKILSNSSVSSRILFSGLFVSNLVIYRDRDLPGYSGDRRFKLYRPTNEMDVNLRVHVSEGVTTFGSFNVNTFDAGTVYTAHLELDSIGVFLKNPSFSLDASYNRQFFTTGDFLGLVGEYPYPDLTFDNPQIFGLGYAGIAFQANVRKTFMRDSYIGLMFSNMFKDWEFEADELDFPNLFARRPLGFWSRQGTSPNKPDDFSDYGTDVFAGRISKTISFIKPGFTFRLDRNQWWQSVDTIRNNFEYMDTIIDEHHLNSDWLDIGSIEIGAGADLTFSIGDFADFSGEYLHWQYRSSIDAGNRENADATGDSTLDITLGKQKGKIIGAGMDIYLPVNLYTSIQGEFEKYEKMNDKHYFVIPQHNNGETGRPTLDFQILPQYIRNNILFEFGYNGCNIDASLGFVNENTESEIEISALNANASLKMLNDRLHIRCKNMYSFGKYYTTNTKFSGFDMILNSIFHFAEVFALEGDILIKNIVRDSIAVQGDSTAFGNQYSKIDETYFAPYIAFRYEPKPFISAEISWGVRPYDLHGKYTGRTQYIYNSMNDNSLSYTEAMKSMHLYQSVNIVATVRY